MTELNEPTNIDTLLKRLTEQGKRIDEQRKEAKLLLDRVKLLEEHSQPHVYTTLSERIIY